LTNAFKNCANYAQDPFLRMKLSVSLIFETSYLHHADYCVRVALRLR
jgi:hypothetical protein